MIKRVALRAGELKAHDSTTADFNVTDGSTFHIFSLVDAIVLGTDRDERIGRRIFIEKIIISYQATFSPVSPTTLGSVTDPCFLRTVIARSRTDLPVGVTDVLFTNGSVNVAWRPIQYYNTVTPAIKKVYKDRRIMLCEPFHRPVEAFAAGTGATVAVEQWLGRNMTPIQQCRYIIRPRCFCSFDSVPVCVLNQLWIFWVASSSTFIRLSNISIRVRFRDV